MEIIVCIKQVPESTEVKINPQTKTLVRESVKGIINPFDMYAIEEALRLKEKLGGKVTALSMGPPQAEESLREAISLGVDEAILLSDKSFAGADTLATAYTLAQAIKRISQFDLIICGKQTMDGDTAQVGPSLAEKLGIPHVAYVRKINEVKTDSIILEQMVEEGYRRIKMSLPGLITVVKEINEPRLPSLRGKMRAKSVEILIWGVNDFNIEKEKVGLEGSPTQVIKIFAPQRRKKGEILQGDIDSQVEQLVNKLKESRVI